MRILVQRLAFPPRRVLALKKFGDPGHRATPPCVRVCMMSSMTRTMRTLGIPAALLALAACGTSEVTGGAPASPTSPISTAASMPGGTPTSTPPSAPDSVDMPTDSVRPTSARPTGPANSPTLGQGPTGPADSQQVFPITVERRGGIAGFRDKIVIAADGTATVTHKTGGPQTCRVDADLMKQIVVAAGLVTWAGRPSDATTPPSRVSDQMWVTVSSGTHHASLSDPGVAKLAGPLGQLLGNLTAPAGERTLCQPI